MTASLYGALLAFLYLGLTYYVIHGRWKYKVSLGDGGHPDLLSRMRIQGNFAEYVPFALLLLFMVDMAGFHIFIIHILGVGLVLARILHAVGLLKKGFNPARALGVVLTHLVIGACGGLLLWDFIVMGGLQSFQ